MTDPDPLFDPESLLRPVDTATAKRLRAIEIAGGNSLPRELGVTILDGPRYFPEGRVLRDAVWRRLVGEAGR